MYQQEFIQLLRDSISFLKDDFCGKKDLFLEREILSHLPSLNSQAKEPPLSSQGQIQRPPQQVTPQKKATSPYVEKKKEASPAPKKVEKQVEEAPISRRRTRTVGSFSLELPELAPQKDISSLRKAIRQLYPQFALISSSSHLHLLILGLRSPHSEGGLLLKSISHAVNQQLCSSEVLFCSIEDLTQALREKVQRQKPSRILACFQDLQGCEGIDFQPSSSTVMGIPMIEMFSPEEYLKTPEKKRNLWMYLKKHLRSSCGV